MYIVIMAGGSGTRFWPMSRMHRPKQFLTIAGDKPMILATYYRVKELAPDENIILVVGEEHREETERLFAGLKVHILVEPVGRNTAPCIGLAAQFVKHCGSNDPVVILPADHYIANPKAFCETLVQAGDTAVEGGIVTLGIVATRPETGYGYIERDVSVPQKGSGYTVRAFTEKPNAAKAEEYLQSGNHYWNAGIFVATPQTLLHEFDLHMPALSRGLKELAPAFNTPRFSSALLELYEKTEKISFDYAVMEKTSLPVYVIPCECGWSDVGSWYSLWEVRKDQEQDEQGNVVDGEAWTMGCRDSFVVSRGKRWVAALGLKKILVVDTEDALLVADLEKSQEVKEIVNYLDRKGLKRLL